MAVTTTRRRQADRSATTRAALAEAAIEVLLEQGWAAATVIEVCNRVGLSRGAFHYHYESLPELLADALRRLYAEMVGSFDRKPTSLLELVDLTWTALGNPRFKAVLEAWLAMANNPGLHDEIGPVVAEFAHLVNPNRSSRLSTSEQRNFFIAAREAMLGLALGRAVNGGEPLGHERRVLAHLRSEALGLDRD
jgi:AcrR family transcriptional regulator